MNFLDAGVETDLMEALRDKDEQLALQIQDLMFVFENLLTVDDRGIQTLLREVKTDTLVVALKGADADMKEKIFKNMSKRASALLQDDLEAKGPVRVSDVEKAQKEILTIAKGLADAGKIIMGAKSEEMI
jgi:flagellar motor switch protein FliG